MYKYYMNERPLGIGAQPKGFVSFDEEDVGGRYGAIYYDRPLTQKELEDYELDTTSLQDEDSYEGSDTEDAFKHSW